MKILVINGTNVKGITYLIKEELLSHLRQGNEIREYYPDDLPPFCLGCKNCFLKGAEFCPHREIMLPIWKDMLWAELIVFAYPIYALRAPASIKSVLDHLCVRWTVHRPEREFFTKTAVIITNSVGAPNGSAQKDVKTSLNWMGLSKIYTLSNPMMGDIFIDKLTEKHREAIAAKAFKLAAKVKNVKPKKRMSVRVWFIFQIAKLEHKLILQGEETPGLDTAHYIANGWIKDKRKRKS